jgi:hypothetical protein
MEAKETKRPLGRRRLLGRVLLAIAVLVVVLLGLSAASRNRDSVFGEDGIRLFPEV